MSHHTYNLRSQKKADRLATLRPPPMDIKKQEVNLFAEGFKVHNGAPLPCGNKKTTKSLLDCSLESNFSQVNASENQASMPQFEGNNEVSSKSPSLDSQTPSPDVYHNKTHYITFINTSVESLSNAELHVYKMKILNEIKRLVEFLDNKGHDALNFSKSDSFHSIERFLKEFDITCGSFEIYAEAKLLLFKNNM